MNIGELMKVLPSHGSTFEILYECGSMHQRSLSFYPLQILPWEEYKPPPPMFQVLPNEVILQILSVLSVEADCYIASQGSACSPLEALTSCSLTCRAARILSQEFLFRRIVIDPFEERGSYRLIRKQESLKTHGAGGIFQYVHCLDFRFACPTCGLKSNGLHPQPFEFERKCIIFKRFLTEVMKIPNFRRQIKNLKFDTRCNCIISATEEHFGWDLVCYVMNKYDFPALKSLSGLRVYQRYGYGNGSPEQGFGYLTEARNEITRKRIPISRGYRIFWKNFRRCEIKDISTTLKPGGAQSWELLTEVFYDPNAREIRVADDYEPLLLRFRNEYTEVIFPLAPSLFKKDPTSSKLTKLELYNVSLSSESLLSILEVSPRLHTLLLEQFAISRGTSETDQPTWLPILTEIAMRKWRELHLKMLYYDDVPHRLVQTSEVEQSTLVKVFQKIWESRLETAVSMMGPKIRFKNIICIDDILCNIILYNESLSPDNFSLAEGGYFKIVGCVK